MSGSKGKAKRTVPVTSWTTDTLREHLQVMHQAEDKFDQERDRRYTEVNLEKEKALRIKETADLSALKLAREIQNYKDEKANELRSQIESERGSYATQIELSSSMEKLQAELHGNMENLTVRMESQTRSTAELAQNIIALRSSLQGQGAGQSEQYDSIQRTRNLILTLAAVAAVVVSLFVGLRQKTPVVNVTPSVTTTTTTAHS